MHILLITDNFYPEGNAIASRVYERACYWVKWGHQVTVITSNPNFPEGKLYPGYKNKWLQVEMLKGIRVIRVKTLIIANKGFFLRVLDFLSFMVPAFVVGLVQKKVDIMVTTSPQFFGAISACFLAKCKQKSLIVELGDLWPASIVSVGAMKESFMIRLLEKIELMLYKMSTHIVVVSPAFKDDLVKRRVPADKISVILNGVDLTKYKPQLRNVDLSSRYNILAEDFVVGYIGTQGMAHGLANVLAAAALLQNEKNIKIIFVGSGAEREFLIAQAKVLQLLNVQFIAAQSKECINDYWSLCDIALVHFKNTATFAGAIPSKIFEAMAMGLPILMASPQGVASQIILDEQVGVWVQPENPQALATAINTLYQQPVERQQFVVNSLVAAKGHSREAQAYALLNTLEQYLHA